MNKALELFEKSGELGSADDIHTFGINYALKIIAKCSISRSKHNRAIILYFY